MRGGLTTFSAQGLRFGLHFISTVVLARLLTPADFGLIAMVTAITNFALVFKDLGLSTATVQRDCIDHRQVSTLFWINVAMGAVLAVLVACCAPVAAWFYRDPRLVPVMVMLATAFVFGGLTVQHQALLRRGMRFAALGAAEVSGMALAVAAAIIAARLGAGYWALVLLHVGIPFGTAVGVWIACPWRPGRPARRSGIRPMLGFGGHITAFNTVNYFAANLDKILIGRVWGVVPLGLYSRAYGLMMLPLNQIRGPLSAVALPALSRLQNEPERYRRAFLRATEKVLLFALPFVAVLLVGADWIIEIALGPQWTGASRIFAWLGLALIAQMTLISSGWLFLSQGRSRDFLTWGLMGSGLSVLSFIVGLPYGAIGVAAADALTSVFIRMPLLVWWMGRRGAVTVRDLVRSLAPFVAVSVLVVLCGVLMRRHTDLANPILGLAVLCALVAALSTILYAIIPSTRTALRDVRHLFSAIGGSTSETRDGDRGALPAVDK